MRLTAIETLGFRTVSLVTHLGRIAAFIGSIVLLLIYHAVVNRRGRA